MGRVVFKISVGFVTGALIMLAISLYMSDRYLKEQQRLADSGDLRGARIQIERAARLDPFSPVPLAAEAYLELRQGRAEAAANALNDAIERDPYNHENYMALGDLQRQQLGDPEAAADTYRKALRYNPNAAAIVLRLAESLVSTGDLEGAEAQYEWLRERGKIPLKELYILGRINVRLEEPEEAIEIFEEARERAEAELDSSGESQGTDKEDFIESLDLAIADALVVQRSYAEAREYLSQSSAEQASAILALLNEDPESYRESVLDAPIS